MPIPDFAGVPVVVTGGAGFIGSHLVDALADRGALVTVLDDLSSGFERNLETVKDRIRLIRGDIRDIETCRTAVRSASIVFHEAARGSVPRSIEDPAGTIDVNVQGTATLLAACRDENVAAIVQASSSSVYGDSVALPKREGEEGKPLSPYAFSKVAVEELATLFARCYGMKIISLRYFNVFGPRQDPNGPYAAVIPRFVAAVRRSEAPVIYGDGEQSRDFTFVEDVVRANLLAGGAPEQAWGRAYNVAPGRAATVNQLVTSILAVCQSGLSPVYLAPRQGDILHSVADSSRARAAFEFEALVSLDEGLRSVCRVKAEDSD